MAKFNFDEDDETPAAPKKKAASKKAASKKKTTTKKAAKKKAPSKKSTAVAKAPKAEVATVSNAGSGVEGEVDETDLILPRVNHVNASSKLHTKEKFDIGALLLSREFEFGGYEAPATVVVLAIRKEYQQKLDIKSDETPQRFNTKAEVIEWGGTLDWSEEAVDDEVYFQKVAHSVVAIQAPEDISEDLHHFPFEDPDGTHWARAIYTTGGGAFNSFAKPVITAAMGKLRATGGIWTAVWELSVADRENDDNAWIVPVAKMKGIMRETSDLQFFAELANDDFSASTSQVGGED